MAGDAAVWHGFDEAPSGSSIKSRRFLGPTMSGMFNLLPDPRKFRYSS